MTAPRVNLLPHRAAKRERQKKLFWFLTGLSAVAGLLMIGVVWSLLQGAIGRQEGRNEFIRVENRKLDTQIKEIATLRQDIDGLRAIKQEDRRVNVVGWATSNERVSEFLRNLQNNSRVIERPDLIEIKVAGQGPAGLNRRVFEFSLNFTLKPTPERTQLSQAPAARGSAAATPPASAAAPAAAPAKK
jgi:type IV pilus assembly protein PilN